MWQTQIQRAYRALHTTNIENTCGERAYRFRRSNLDVFHQDETWRLKKSSRRSQRCELGESLPRPKSPADEGIMRRIHVSVLTGGEDNFKSHTNGVCALTVPGSARTSRCEAIRGILGESEPESEVQVRARYL